MDDDINVYTTEVEHFTRKNEEKIAKYDKNLDWSIVDVLKTCISRKILMNMNYILRCILLWRPAIHEVE